MSIYAIRGQSAFDRSRAEPQEDPERDQSDAVWDALQQVQATVAAAISLMSRSRKVEAYGHVDNARALLNELNTQVLS